MRRINTIYIIALMVTITGLSAQALAAGTRAVSAGVRTQKPVYAVNEAIRVSYSGLPGYQQDWITIVKTGTREGGYGQWFYTKGRRSGSLSFRGLARGSYEVRAHYNWPKGGNTIRARYRFVVRATGGGRTSQPRCGLGAVWTEAEVSGWQGVWRRRGTSNVFDARWTLNGYRDETATLRITIRGSQVYVSRRNIGDPNGFGVTSCRYSGTIAADGVTVSGTYYCNTGRGRTPTYRWSATIGCNGGGRVSCSAQSWVGRWKTSYGEMNLSAYGNRVTGNYGNSNQLIDGRVYRSGNYCILKGLWKRGNSTRQGPIYFVLTSTQNFTGRWDYRGRTISLSAALRRPNWNGSR